jgi:hypothetical protein
MQNQLNIFLLIGQSNMAGRGRPGEVPERRHPLVSMFRDSRWVQAVEPLHTDKPKIAGIGLAMSFALDVMESGGLAPIGLVPCAVGGTPLSRWMPGADLYDSAVTIARCALKSGTLKGILWHQGENDAGRVEDSASYGERFRTMIRQLREDLSAPSVPVIAGELGPFLRLHKSCPHFGMINRQLRDLEGVLPAYACAGADGLQDQGDCLHFSSAALREFGLRYARRFLALSRPVHPDPRAALAPPTGVMR